MKYIAELTLGNAGGFCSITFSQRVKHSIGVTQGFNASTLLEYCIVLASFFHLPIELGRTEITRLRIWLGFIPTFRKHRMPVISLSLEQKVHSIQEPKGDVSRASERV